MNDGHDSREDGGRERERKRSSCSCSTGVRETKGCMRTHGRSNEEERGFPLGVDDKNTDCQEKCERMSRLCVVSGLRLIYQRFRNTNIDYNILNNVISKTVGTFCVIRTKILFIFKTKKICLMIKIRIRLNKFTTRSLRA